MFPFLIGGAVAVDAFAAGVWLGHRWGASSNASDLRAAVEEAVKRATTLPAGGIPEMAREVAQNVTDVAQGVQQVVQAGTQAAQTVTTAVQQGQQATSDVHAALNAALAAAKATSPK